MAEQNQIENEQAMSLAESRKNDGPSDAGPKAPVGPKVEMLDGGLMLAIAGFNDLTDYLVIGSIPIVGDIIDGIVWFSIYAWVMSKGLDRPQMLMWSGAVEMIPLGDLLPTYTAMVMTIILYNNNPQFRTFFGG